ncbi:MAG: hypothetical protein IAE78_00545 [Myxococcus sp.]|nr:hypothetical protein [Myxococcus sp.]
MAPRIPNTPSVRIFTETWSKDFREAVTRAAGKDGRLSIAEARKLAASAGPERVFADNALSHFEATGKKSVSVEVLAREMTAYAQRAAELAAGPDKKLSLADGARLPGDLVEDFFMLRGKAAPGAQPAPSALPAVQAALEAASAGLFMPSETDASFKFVKGAALNGAPITADVVRAQLGAQHDALISSVMYVDPSEVALAGKTQVEQRDGNAFLDRVIANVDPGDPDSVAMGQRFAELKAKLGSELTDLTVFRFGTVSISTFLVGRTRTGELAGLLTGQVET